jgi:hypothetical protein
MWTLNLRMFIVNSFLLYIRLTQITYTRIERIEVGAFLFSIGSRPPENEEVALGNESYMKFDSMWSEKLMLAVLGLLILAAAAQVALKYVR